MSTSSTSSVNVPFTGISQYASDFQAILNKAVQVAQIPLTELQNRDSTVLSKETALGSFSTTVANLATSLQNLGQLAANQAVGATSSDQSVVTVTANDNAAPATYTINSVTSAASAAAELSTGSYADSSATGVGSMTLVVNGQDTTFALPSNNLNGLVQQINSLNAGVSASVVSSDGSNYLSITGAPSIQLYDAPSATGTDLLTATGSGTEQSTAGFASATNTAVSSPSFTLQYGSQTYALQLNDNNDNLAGLRDAINNSGAGVTASILTTSSGNYLSVQANASGATTLKLFAGTSASGTDLLTQNDQGSDAVFQLDGIPIDQPGNVVNNVIPGVTFTIEGKSSSPVTMTLSSDPTQLSSALQDFVTNYNALASAITQQTGQTGGPLTGDTVLNQVQSLLQQISGYTSAGGTVQSLADLGVEFSDTGQATFNQTTFDSLTSSQISDAFKYIGSTTMGLGAFSQQLTQFSDPVTGIIQDEVSGLKQTDQDLQNQITAVNQQVTNVQNTMTAQMEAADALQAELQQQQSDLNASLQGLNLVLYGKNTQTF